MYEFESTIAMIVVASVGIIISSSFWSLAILNSIRDLKNSSSNHDNTQEVEE